MNRYSYRGPGPGQKKPSEPPGLLKSFFYKVFPKYPDKREKIKHRLSFVYAFFAWNAVALIMYHQFKTSGEEKDKWKRFYGRPEEDETHSPTLEWAKALQLQGQARVIRISGFTKVGDEVVDLTPESEDKPEQP